MSDARTTTRRQTHAMPAPLTRAGGEGGTTRAAALGANAGEAS